jgi:lipoate-protein ligase B
VTEALRIRDLGRVGYAGARALMLELVERRARNEVEDQLLLCEHDPVITLGRGASLTDVANAGDIPIVPVERGGETTYHGPGQLVGYWIRRLESEHRDLHAHLRRIEDRLILALRSFDLEGTRNPGLTGVWVVGKKIASIGIAVRRWVTYHGFALNVSTDLSAFARIRPCGLDPAVMTSLSLLLARPVSLADAAREVARAFTREHP